MSAAPVGKEETMMKYGKLFSLRKTPQSEPVAGTVANSAGGYAFPVDDWTRLDRFLVLGTEGESYYAGERKLTVGNAEAVMRCTAADGTRTVARITEMIEQDRAPKPAPALFTLALATALGDEATKQAAFAALPRIARTGTAATPRCSRFRIPSTTLSPTSNDDTQSRGEFHSEHWMRFPKKPSCFIGIAKDGGCQQLRC
jgi:hypothetical protein